MVETVQNGLLNEGPRLKKIKMQEKTKAYKLFQ
jgi:hypothetical protein